MDKPWLKFYEKGVPEYIDIPEFTLSEMLEHSAKRFPNNKALVYFGKSLSYRHLDRLVNKFAGSLLAIGLKEGDKVAIQLPNCPQFVIAYYGTLRAGCVAVPVNPLYLGRDLEFILKDSGAKLALTFSKNYYKLKKVKLNTQVKIIIVTNIKEYFPKALNILFTLAKEKREGHRLRSLSKDTVTWKQFLRFRKGNPPKVSIPHNDLAVLQYTGGTTGLPKGAMLSNDNLVSNVWQIKHWLIDLEEGKEVFISAIPYFHIYGMTVALNLVIATGSLAILFPQVDIKRILKSIEKYRPTIFPGIPAIYAVINNVKEIERYDIKSIRVCISGAAALPKDVKNTFEKLTGAKLVEGYGLTEASPVTHANPIYGKNKECIGLPIPLTEGKIVDMDRAKDLRSGQVGELAVKGPQVMKGYFKAEYETDACLRDGWLLTGDMAYMDKDGYFHIVDRKKDLIITSGLNVYPREVEEIIEAFSGVAECAIVGAPHKSKGEVITAFIVPEEGKKINQKKLKQYCKQELPLYKRPRDFIVIDEIPKTLIGKPLRKELRKKLKNR